MMKYCIDSMANGDSIHCQFLILVSEDNIKIHIRETQGDCKTVVTKTLYDR